MTLIILAAGMASRFGELKQISPVSTNKEAIMDFSIYDAAKVGFKNVVFIVRKEILSEIKNLYELKLKAHNINVSFAIQDTSQVPEEFKTNARTKPWGTAHALLAAKDFVKGNFCVINADDFYGRNAFNVMYNFLKNTPKPSASYSMVGYPLENTLSENGSVSRGECLLDTNDYLTQVTEHTQIKKQDQTIISTLEDSEVELNENTIVSMNFWGFTPEIFKTLETMFYTFLKKYHTNTSAEFLLPNVVNQLLQERSASVKVLKTNSEWIGMTYKSDQDLTVDKIKQFKQAGTYPKKLW